MNRLSVSLSLCLFTGYGESIKLRYPTPIMASVDNHQTTNFISVFYFYLSGHELITTADWANLGCTLTE